MTPQVASHMNHRQLGETDLFVSPIGLGCWPISGMTSLDVNEPESLKTLFAAVESGINFLDTAHCYGLDGNSERLIGELLREHREKMIVASKGGIHWDHNGVRHYGGRPERIIVECDESLRRMKIDMIDLYYLHAPDPAVPVEESAAAFNRLLETGKIRSVGVSNLDLDQMAAFHSVCPISAAQPPYNMLQRSIESDLIPWCLSNRVSVVNYWPLMKGLLAGKIRRGHSFDPADKRLTYDIFQEPKFEQAQRLLDELDVVANELGKTVAQVVVNWTMNRPGITSVLCGAKRDWQIQETALAMGWNLSQHQLDRIAHHLDNVPRKPDDVD